MSGGRGSRSCCCSGVCAFFFSAGFLVLIYWATFQPRHIRASVSSASLSDLTVNKTSNVNGAVVHYRLAVNLTIHNPSRRVAVYFDAIEAWLLANGASSLGEANATSPAVFHVARRSRADVAVEFEYGGGVGVRVAGDVADEMEREIVVKNGGGVVGLEMEVYTRVRYRLGFVMVRARPRIRCEMRIPVKEERRRRGGHGSVAAGVLSPGDRCAVKY
uniref:Uncharacterized protein n=1 Tax=Leersia perrieri TaxID=77586 RepID=A0A0D9XX34_9ORYZ